MLTFKQFAAEVKKIKKTQTVALVGHIACDPDCLCSLLTMHAYLAQLGINSKILAIKKEVERLNLCEYDDRFLDKNLITEETHFDAVFVLDCNSFSRISKYYLPVLEKAGLLFCIDHHEYQEEPCKNFLSTVGAGSATEVLYDLFKADGVNMTKEMAETIYMGFASDTVALTKNQGQKQYLMLADLCTYGINTDELINRSCKTTTLSHMKLISYALKKLKSGGNGFYYAFLNEKKIRKLNNDSISLDQPTFYIQNLKEVKVLLLAKKLKDGKVIGSFRSACDVNVDCIATEIGGGGHKKAAGFTSQLKPRQIVKKVKEALCRQKFLSL